MSDLHPAARALIEAAKAGESLLPAGTRSRVRTTVLRRTAAFGLTLTSTTAVSVAAKGGAIATALASPLVSAGAIGVVGTAAFLVARAVWVVPAPALALAPPDVAHVAPRPAVAAAPGAGQPLEHASPLSSASPVASSFARAIAPPPVSKLPPTSELVLSERILPLRPDPPPVAPATVLPPTVGDTDPLPRAVETFAIDQVVPLGAARPVIDRTSDLAAAIDILHRARSALRAGQPGEAFGLLRGSAELLEAGPLAEEAQAALASALCQLGRSEEARAAIDRFLVRWPASPLAMRLRDGCSALGGIGAAPAK